MQCRSSSLALLMSNTIETRHIGAPERPRVLLGSHQARGAIIFFSNHFCDPHTSCWGAALLTLQPPARPWPRSPPVWVSS